MKKLWFRNKTYGFGLNPSCWEGWAVIGVFLLVVFITVPIVAAITNTESMFALVFLPTIIIEIATFLFVTYKKGEKVEWRWGKKK